MFKKKRLIRTAIIVASVVFTLYLAWISWFQRELTLYEPDSFGPDGFKALALFLQKAGFVVSKTQTVTNDYNRLLIVPSAGLADRDQKNAVLEWVGSGGQVLELAGSQPVLWPSPCVAPGGESDHNLKSPLWAKAGKTDGPDGLIYHSHNEWLCTVAKPDEGYLRTKAGYFVYRFQYGKGAIIHWNDPGGLVNSHLKKYPDNAVILALIIQNLTNRIDFYANPFRNRIAYRDETASDLPRYWIAFLLILAGLGLILWKLAGRFGRPRPLILTKGRSGDEFIYSMAMLFRQAGARNFVINKLYHSLIGVMNERAGLSGETHPHTLAQRLLTLGHNEAIVRKALETLETAKQAQNRRLSGRAFLELATKLDSLRKELQQWKG